MRKGIFFSLLCLVAVLAVACGGGNNGNDSGDTDNGGEANGGENGEGNGDGNGEGNGGGGDVDDSMAFYKTAGNYYVMKSTSIVGGNESVSGMRVEVTASDDESYTTETTMLDANLEPMANTQPTTQTVEWPTGEGDATNGDAPEIEYEEVEVAGETVNAMKVVSGNSTSWSYKGVPVKSVTKNDTMESTSEVVEFELN